MTTDVLPLLENARDRFSLWLSRYRAWHGVNGITERNLSFQIATSFLARYPDGSAFMEVPFSDGPAKRTDKHLDAYCLSAPLALMFEAKIVWAPQQVSWIADDIARMTPALASQLRTRHTALLPARTRGLVVAETWSRGIESWWCGDDSARPRWQRAAILPPKLTEGWRFGSVTVHRASEAREETLIWLYGIGPEIEVSASGTAV